MIPKDCKRLAEVDFPIAAVSRHAAREKSIRHGHPSTLHLWWARRPLASSRAVLLGLLWPDPCDPLCPHEFKEQARKLLRQVGGCNPGTTDEDLRKALLRFIADFANWDLASNRTYLDVSRALVKAAHGEEPPLVVDPFAGGGSIPLEALRVGCEAFASDLNPVACLILKVMLEDIPRHGPKLAEELRRVGGEIKKKAEKELADFYPKDPDGAMPIAYLWARTVHCESPNCGAEIPLVRSFWLTNKSKQRKALRWTVERPNDGPPRVLFEIFTPKADSEVPHGTISHAKASCPCCGVVIGPDRIRAQLGRQHGGGNVSFDESGRRIGGALLIAVVTSRPGQSGRFYRLASDRDYNAVQRAGLHLARLIANSDAADLPWVPNELIPDERVWKNNPFRIQHYGMGRWGDLFTARQKLALVTLAKLTRDRTKLDGNALQSAMAIVVDRCADYTSTVCVWNIPRQLIAHTFGRQALPMTWDFCEAQPVGDGPGNLEGAIEWVAKVVEAWPGSSPGQFQLTDAAEHSLPSDSASVWFTDPPYYDAVPYADLSDFFFVWLKRALPDYRLLRDRTDPSNPLTPKIAEIVLDEVKSFNGRPKDRTFFEERMAAAFAEGRRVTRKDGIGSVVFAHKTTEGWEALLTGLIKGGWTVTGSWPIATERPGRLRSQDSAALATSVHLICRPRPDDAPIGDWANVLRELPKRVGDWMDHLQSEGIRGADLVFACIGPALEIFSRYSRVETAEGRAVSLPDYLEKVWEIVGRTALRQVLGTDAPADFGEDARLTALFLWTLQTANGSSDAATVHVDDGDGESDAVPDEDDDDTPVKQRIPRGYTLPFDIVRRIAQPLGIRLDRWNRRLLEIDKGTVRLLPLPSRASFLVEPGIAHDLALVDRHRRAKSAKQLDLFEETPDVGRQAKAVTASARVERQTWSQLHLDSISTLDHVHKAMLFQKQGATNALRELLFYERHYRPEFVRLANALSALYPRGSEEKRLLDAMLLAVPR